jgi:hypothetical protein
LVSSFEQEFGFDASMGILWVARWQYWITRWRLLNIDHIRAFELLEGADVFWASVDRALKSRADGGTRAIRGDVVGNNPVIISLTGCVALLISFHSASSGASWTWNIALACCGIVTAGLAMLRAINVGRVPGVTRRGP